MNSAFVRSAALEMQYGKGAWPGERYHRERERIVNWMLALKGH